MMKYFPNVSRSVPYIRNALHCAADGSESSLNLNTRYNAYCQDAWGLWILVVDSLNISGCINWIWNYSRMMDRFSEPAVRQTFSQTQSSAIVKALQ